MDSRRLTGRLVQVVALVIVAVVGPLAAPGNAHAQVETTAPQAGATLDVQPETVSIRFNEPIRSSSSGIALFNASAERLATGPTTARNTVLSTSLDGTIPEGAYVVVWRAVSNDGHPIRGSFTFQIGEGDQKALAALGESELISSNADPWTSRAMQAVRFLLWAATALVIAATMWRLTAVSSNLNPTVLRTAGAMAPIAAVALSLIDGPYSEGRPLSAVSMSLVNGSLGSVTVRAAIGVGFTAFLGSRVLCRDDVPKLVLLATVGLLGALAGATGHAVAAARPLGAVTSTAVHIVAGSTWAGGLALLMLARWTATSVDVRRWSGLAQAAVLAIAVTGSANAIRQVGSIEALRTTTYGRILMAKMGLVMVMLVLGASQRRRSLTRDAAAGDGESAGMPEGPTRTGGGGGAGDALSVRVVGVESMLGIAVLALSVLLASTIPARAAVSKPISLRVQTASTRSDITIAPARTGRNVVHLYVFDENGVTMDITDATFVLTHTKTGTEIEVDPFRAGRGHEEAADVALPFAGNWQVETRIYLTEFDVETVTASFTVR